MPQEKPHFHWSWNPVKVVGGSVAAIGVGATIWWGAKVFSPVCGPAVAVCAVAF